MPFDDRSHGALHTRFVADDAADLLCITKASGGDQDKVCGDKECAKRKQAYPASFFPLSHNLANNFEPRQYGGKSRSSGAPTCRASYR